MNLVGLMSRDFTKLFLMSFVVSAPVTYLLLDSYLQRCTIRTSIDLLGFAITDVVALVFALFFVVNQARRAVLANPATSLRNE